MSRDREEDLEEGTSVSEADIEAIRKRKPTRKQIRYYHYLCRELGMPYEVAAQQLITSYVTYGALEIRIKNLLLMRTLHSLFRENNDHVMQLLWSLSRLIEAETKEVLTKEQPPICTMEMADIQVKEEFKVPVQRSDGKRKKSIVSDVLGQIKKLVGIGQ